jgi:hypothetical protein
MKSCSVWMVNVVLLAAMALASPLVLRADRLQFKDGKQLQGIIKKIANGKVTVEVGGETKIFNILDITSMDFDTPHVRLAASPARAETQAQQLLVRIQAVDQAAAQMRQLIDETKKEWGPRKSIPPSEVPEWNAAKDRVARAASRYQEVLNDLYSQVAGKVNEYDRLMHDANQLYVGVQGPFNVGSPLISEPKRESLVRRYMPTNWYETIFYAGYRVGYNEGYYGAKPREFTAPQQ